MCRIPVLLFVFACICIGALNASYNAGNLGYGGPIVRRGYAAPAVVQLRQQSVAKTAALTDGAGARAVAVKYNRPSYSPANYRYGYDIGRPVLVGNIGKVTPLYAASLAPTSFIGSIDPGFKSYNGRIIYQNGYNIGVVRLP